VIVAPNKLPEAKGIHPSDFILRTAMLAALQDMRDNPDLLEWVFAAFKDDPTTKDEYRQKQIDEGKQWFLNTKIPVLVYPRQDQIEFPCITLALRDSVEVENTTGDTHYMPEEEQENYWPDIVTFQPAAFDLAQGLITVPAEAQGQVITSAMIVLDATGREFPVTAASDGNTIQIAPNPDGDFSKVTLKGPRNGYTMSLESASFRETYSVGCHAQGEVVYAMYLHAIVVFMLLRYRQELLEARGFERSTISSNEFIPDASYLEGKENVFSRYVQLNGFVRQYWPKYLNPKALSVRTGFVVSGADRTPPTSGKAQDQVWTGENDTIA
jgi:hypothetical protein